MRLFSWVRGKQKTITVSAKRVPEFLGRNVLRHDRIMSTPQTGVVTGLAWTQAGGEILFIETAFTKGNGEITITGQLGDVMQESAKIAITLVKELYPDKAEKFKENSLHIHVPSGAVPKDGPSAGITLVTALSSLVTGKKVPGGCGDDGGSVPARSCHAIADCRKSCGRLCVPV